MAKKYPIFLNLKNRNILIVGGGFACLEKLQGLEHTEASITIISKEINDEVRDFMSSKGNIRFELREINAEDLSQRDIVFLATNDPQTNRVYREIAHQNNTWANSVDDPANCDFYSASLIDLGSVVFSISTDGQFAGLTAALRRLFEEIIPAEDTELFQKIYEMRTALKEKLPDMRERRKVLKRIISDLETGYFRK